MTFDIDDKLDERERFRIDFFYPSNKGTTKESIVIGLEHVRAADSITVRYDFERDGYVIQMDRTRDEGSFAEVVEEEQEVAFIPAWNEEP
jgi:hypothetical protein